MSSTDTPSASTEERKDGLDLSPTKIIASALAAISTAVASSYLGTMGTWIGAGVGSVIATVSTSLYHHSLTRTTAKLKTVVPIPAGLTGHGDARDAADRNPGAAQQSQLARIGVLLGSVRWGRLAAVAGIVFALAIGSILAYEVLTHRPLSAQVRGEDVKGTSLTPKHTGTVPATAPVPSQPGSPAADPSPQASVQGDTPSPAESAQPAPSGN